MSTKIRQSHEVKGVQLYGNEVKLCQFADDTNLFCADLMSVENGLRIIFGSEVKYRENKSHVAWEMVKGEAQTS